MTGMLFEEKSARVYWAMPQLLPVGIIENVP